ncbi:vestitone reductase-like isoform X2 [Prunus dulcis]|uniref:vestitone reductase-like isoform X2 n=1 Tax=Prunus dulcis TaxID=3755 RepID=UPI0014826C5D|nr:vestitone reductase-like isoform X2 [Prunus dulcis]
MEKGPVCVTGGTGFVASWLVMRLLQHGYTVRTTVRPDPECKRDLSFLTSLPRASENLQIFNADLNKPDSFNEAIEGCIGVFHVAHPMPTKELDEEVVTKKAVQGALGILKACLNSKTVKRVVYTSSASTVAYSGGSQDLVDESSWSDIEFHRSLKIFGTSYVAAKTKTEQAILEFAEKSGLEVVTLIPPLVVGGFICKNFPSSVYLALAMILDQVPIDEMSQFLSAKYPDFPIPTTDFLKGIEGYKSCGFSSQKLLSSGFKFKHGLDDMFGDAIQSCRGKGFL